MAKLTGYQGFGSFHSASVEELINQPAAEYVFPTVTFDVPNVPELCNELGEGLSNNEQSQQTKAVELFLLDFKSWTFLNHGAFGTPFGHAQHVADLWRRHAELQPLRFLDRELLPHLVCVLRRMAAFLHCDPRDLALLQHATAGLNTVLQGADYLKAGDVIYSLDVGYGSVKRMIEHVCSTKGAVHVEGKLLEKLPLRNADDIAGFVEGSLPANAKLAVFDAVTSNTALALPLQELVSLCKSRGCKVLMDGAHALGQLPSFHPASLGADYVVMNCHKWLCAPRGCAVMWVARERQSDVRPLNISHGCGSGFTSDFVWDGNRDYSAWLALPAVLDCWSALGGTDVVIQRNQHMLKQAVDLLCTRWQTDLFAPLQLCGCMALVELPARLQLDQWPLVGDVQVQPSAAAKWIQDTLHMVHSIEVPIKAVQGKLYVRISVHVYNDLKQFERLADVVNGMKPPGNE